MRKALSTPHSEATLPFSSAVWAGDLLFVSGQASVDESGAYVEDTFEGEFLRSISKLQEILSWAGLSMDDVVQVTAYLADESDRAEYNALYRGSFGVPYPARTSIVCGIANLKFELDAVAYRSKSPESRIEQGEEEHG
ncbi:RidA family protein [Microbacterium sp. LWO12-1.2]|uniref:RidA family protein n=1 Tax=Microbacterium sp. LWO12-1.2 TaxID=3135261 RepID=UPI003412337F